MNTYIKPITILLFIFTISLSYSDEKISAVQRAQGYFALEHVLGKQKGLDKILIIKHPRESIKTLIKSIAAHSDRVDKQIKSWQEKDSSIIAKDNGFPFIEAKSRENMESYMTKQLLLSGGHNFELKILASQLEALKYIAYTLGALEESEINESRKKQLDKDKKVFEKMLEQTFALLGVK